MSRVLMEKEIRSRETSEKTTRIGIGDELENWHNDEKEEAHESAGCTLGRLIWQLDGGESGRFRSIDYSGWGKIYAIGIEKPICCYKDDEFKVLSQRCVRGLFKWSWPAGSVMCYIDLCLQKVWLDLPFPLTYLILLKLFFQINIIVSYHLLLIHKNWVQNL